MRIAIVQAQAGELQALSDSLALPVIEPPTPGVAIDFDYLLLLDGGRLLLRSTAVKTPGELFVDFSDAKLHYRADSAMRKQNIAKAIGLKGEQRPRVLDATAGLGKDAFLLASMGCEVLMLERSQLVHALLAHGLSRSDYYDAATAEILARMQLSHTEFLDFNPAEQHFDVVYLDPMFEPRRKSAKVKKDMALLQQLLGFQSDGEELLAHARRIAKKRVVVKRAKLSPQLSADKPDIEFKGSSSRYDVYLRV